MSPRTQPPQELMPPPEAVRKVFGQAAETACRYVSLLAERAVPRGLLGPREVPRLWDRHILNCAALAELIPPRCELVDIGSGAGLPGIVLAMLLPGCRVVLLEPMLRRTVFLSECAGELNLGNVMVCRGRAEEMAGVIQADVATARAVAPLDRLAGLAAGVVRPGGLILAVKGREAGAELAGAGAVLRRLGVHDAEVVAAGHGIVEPPATVIRFLSGAQDAG